MECHVKPNKSNSQDQSALTVGQKLNATVLIEYFRPKTKLEV